MNNLFSGTFSHFQDQDQSPPPNSQVIEMTQSISTGDVNLDRFFEEVETIKEELWDLETLYSQLQAAHEQNKTLHNAKIVKDLWAKMDNDIAISLKKAKIFKV
ncbi:Syntaxin [Abeliophyllum distichum]|uniref:Syntaxin n=1 Tax=Abeliophyllum distichum TaxID=126358 RepID=A0ABD1RBC7_9LAMI